MKVVDIFENTEEPDTSHHPLITNPFKAFYYAMDVIGGRWKEAEPIIMTDPSAAVEYARDVINRGKTAHKDTIIRWKEAEPMIMKSPSSTVRYIIDVLGPSLKLDQPKSPDQIRELLTDDSLIKFLNKKQYDDIVKRLFPRSSLLVDRWVGYGNHIRQRKPRGAK